MASRRGRIVVVDDTDLVQKTLARYLGSLGFEAISASGAQQGLDAIRAHAPDLVLCDLRMPEVDGLELLAVARREFPNLPLIVMSGAGLIEDAIGALKLGAWDYIGKPFDLAALKHAIDKALERAELIEQGRRYRQDLESLNGELRRNLRLLADDEAAGRQLQFRMLPRDHLSFGEYRFTRDLVPSTFLSGDFVDAFRIDEQHFGFYLADVAGHGVASALVTVLLRTFVQRQLSAFERSEDPLILSPGRLLTRLNDYLLHDELEKHLTIFYGVVDLETDTLLYATAGHFPWPVLCDGEQVTVLEHPGIPVGMLPGARYDEHQRTLTPAMCLSVFSDGLLDTLGQPGLREKLAYLRGYFGRLDVSIEAARKDLGFGDGRAQPDDIALLMIRRGGPDGDRPRA
jgi:sigma-B regulation protein RsbU (phosphoserine phosphatase)